MSNKKIEAKDYLFITDDSGKLKFKGEFEKFYKEVEEPWGQSGADERLKEYYSYSRKKLIENINSISLKNKNILEIGCGQGYVTELIQKYCSFNTINGMDISETAIKKAKEIHNDIDFFVGNICNKNLELNKNFDIVIFNEVLWYLLEDIDIVFDNLNKIIEPNGYLIFSTSFFKEQKYGTDLIDGYNGLLKFMLNNYDNYQLVSSFYDNQDIQIHHLGLVIYQKTNDNNN